MKNNLQSIIKNAILHHVDENRLICSKRNVLYESIDEGNTWSKFLEIPCDFKTKLILRSRLGRRLLRTYVYHVILQENHITIFAFGKIFIFSLRDKTLLSVNHIKGSRPLVLDSYQGDVFYGEYTSNKERNPISLYKSDKDKLSFEPFHIYKNIRHIHSVQSDPYTEKLYIATGDNDDECFIGYFDNEKFIPIIEGSQQSRAIQLLFDKDFIYFATDAPDEENYIYKLRREDSKLEKLQRLGGPVFYGFQKDNLLFYSTVCEPSKVNSEKNIELWASLNGNDWKCVLTLKKDIFHMTFFQYGQILFPKGSGSNEYLFVTPFSTQFDQQILRISYSKIIEKLQ